MPKDMIKLPQDRTALSIIANPANTRELEDGDEFRKDGFIYDKKGQRKRRWFINFGTETGRQFRLWEPKVKDILWIERHRFRVLGRMRRTVYKKGDEIFAAMKKAGEAYLPIKKDRYFGRRYYVTERGGITWDWIEKRPKKLANVELARAFERNEKEIMNWNSYKFMLDELLMKAIYEKFGWPKERTEGRILLKMNGRNYWMSIERNRWGTLVWNRISWPDLGGDGVIEVI